MCIFCLVSALRFSLAVQIWVEICCFMGQGYDIVKLKEINTAWTSCKMYEKCCKSMSRSKKKQAWKSFSNYDLANKLLKLLKLIKFFLVAGYLANVKIKSKVWQQIFTNLKIFYQISLKFVDTRCGSRICTLPLK